MQANAILIEDEVTVVTYKAKTLQQTLSEIAGLLVLIRVASLILGLFHEYRYNRKIMKETQEEFREVFTYENFKKQILINEQQDEKIERMFEKINEMQMRFDLLIENAE